MELCTKGLGSSVNTLKTRGVSLACVRTCVVVAEERPRINLTSSFSKLFSALGLSPRAVSTSFGCRVNVTICLQVRNSTSTNLKNRLLPKFNGFMENERCTCAEQLMIYF